MHAKDDKRARERDTSTNALLAQQLRDREIKPHFLIAKNNLLDTKNTRPPIPPPP